MGTTMHAKDVISASLAECFITIDDKRYNFMQAIDIEAKFKKTKKKVAILGRTGMGNKATGWEGTGKAKFYYNTSLFRSLMIDYVNTGKDIYFEMQISNEDPTSDAGRQTVTLYGCNIDNGVFAKLKAGDDLLEDEFDFTFEDVKMGEVFNQLVGMEV